MVVLGSFSTYGWKGALLVLGAGEEENMLNMLFLNVPIISVRCEDLKGSNFELLKVILGVGLVIVADEFVK